MKNRTVEFMLFPQGSGIDQIAVMAQRHVSFHVADNKRLDIVMVVSAGSRVPHMADSNIAFSDPVQGFTVKYFSHQSFMLVMLKHTVAGNRNPAAFLSPVLQCV